MKRLRNKSAGIFRPCGLDSETTPQSASYTKRSPSDAAPDCVQRNLPGTACRTRGVAAGTEIQLPIDIGCRSRRLPMQISIQGL